MGGDIRHFKASQTMLGRQLNRGPEVSPSQARAGDISNLLNAMDLLGRRERSV